MSTCNKYKLLDREIIGYFSSTDSLSIFNLTNPTILEENVDPSKEENANLQIINIGNFNFKRTDDKRLEDYSILSYMDLCNEYLLIKHKISKLPKSVRDLVVKKYIEVLEFIKQPVNTTEND